MKKIIFILGIVLSTHSFAETGTNAADLMCKFFENIAGTAHTLRQDGMKASDITDKLLGTLSATEKEYNDNKINKSTDDARKNEIDENLKKYQAAAINYSKMSVQQAFTVPIQPTEELRTEVIMKYAKNAYLNCMRNIYERNK
jgi:hypothetical protein